jgi:hypothetical protein
MTYVRHCTQPSLAGLLTQLAHAPALTCRAIFTRPSTTPAHEARAGDPGYGALPNRSLHLVSHPPGLIFILVPYPDLTVVVSHRSGRVEILPYGCVAPGALKKGNS